MIAGLIICTSLTVVDGDTVKCDGQNMRLLGEGVPFVSGIDTPEIGSHAKCIKERKLALIAKRRLKSFWLKRDCVSCLAARWTRHKRTGRSSTSTKPVVKKSERPSFGKALHDRGAQWSLNIVVRFRCTRPPAPALYFTSGSLISAV